MIAHGNIMVKNEEILLNELLPIWKTYPLDKFVFYNDNSVDQTVEVINDILVDEDTTIQNTMLDESYAEYFFLVNADREIPSEDICPVLGDTKVRGITLNDIPFDCADVQTFGRYDIYGTNATDEDPCDD